MFQPASDEVTAMEMAGQANIALEAFRASLRNARLTWHSHRGDWTVTRGSPQHEDMLRVLRQMTPDTRRSQAAVEGRVGSDNGKRPRRNISDQSADRNSSDGTDRAWSVWCPFPNPKLEETLFASRGPGVYELRCRDGTLILFGIGGDVARRMASLLPAEHGGSGTRNNNAKRQFVAANIADIEYRTLTCATRDDAAGIERMMRRKGGYIFGT